MTPFKVRRGSLFLDAGDSIQGQERDFFLDVGDFIQGKEEFLSGFWKYLVTLFKLRRTSPFLDAGNIW